MIKFYQEENIFKLDTDNTSYIFELYKNKYLIHLYFGPKVNDYDLGYLKDNVIRSACCYEYENGKSFSLDNEMLEYSYFNGQDNNVSALKIKNIYNEEALNLVFDSYKIKKTRTNISVLPHARNNTESLEIKLKDTICDIEVILNYNVYAEFDVICRNVNIINKNKEDIIINKAASLCLDLENNEYESLILSGSYALERIKNRNKIVQGVFQSLSKRGISSHQQNPFLAVLEEKCDENVGRCYGINLIYSGNFLNEVEKNQYGNVRILSGLNPDYFSYTLKENEVFETPECIMTFSEFGLGQLSRNFHEFINKNIMPTNISERPVCVNTWEGATFNINESKLLKYAESASEIKADIIVLDDGWFGRRNDDLDGLGDWYINKEKFKTPFNETIRKIHNLGLKFGIWIEPEMTSLNSDLTKNHNDYIIKDTNLKPLLSRNQYILDLSKNEVKELVLNNILNILDNYDIDYIKWDMNRPFSNVNNNILKNKKELTHRYMLNLYDILNKIRDKYPNLIIETCAGGGGRFDLGMLYYSNMIWTSDNTSPYERTLIQDGTSIAYPLSAISSHVASGLNGGNMVNTSHNYRYTVASSAMLGYELDFENITEDEKEIIKEEIRQYKKYQKELITGDLYRLSDPLNSRYYSFNVVSKDKRLVILKVIQNRGLCNQKSLVVRLQGLDKDRKYRNSLTNQVFYGSTYMNIGLKIDNLDGDFNAITILLESED